jgi:hypothetical protein
MPSRHKTSVTISTFTNLTDTFTNYTGARTNYTCAYTTTDTAPASKPLKLYGLKPTEWI